MNPRTVRYTQIVFVFFCSFVAVPGVCQEAKPKNDDSVKPGVNDRFLDPELNVDEWIQRFEIESREVFSGRKAVLNVCDLKPGMIVADIGAGTGFYSRLFSEEVTESGWVYAVDISARFLEHINRQSQKDEIENITTVLCSDRRVNLPTARIDFAFVCDTYHHFEYPKSTLESIYRALKPGGSLVVIDFERIPGVSRDWTLGHVRAGKKVFQKEIVDAGFKFVGEFKPKAFKENYLLRFEK